MTKTEIQEALVELQLKTLDLEKQLDKCPDDAEPFTCKGGWYTLRDGKAYNGANIHLSETFNLWQTKEIAEKAYALQLVHRKMLSFVSQHQELNDGSYYLLSSCNKYLIKKGYYSYPDRVMMTKETADLMLEAIENGSLILEERT